MYKSAGDLYSNDEHQKRLLLRDNQVRRRAMCLHCNKKIPKERRIDALVCSRACRNSLNWTRRDKYRTEIQHALKLEKYPDLLTMRCPCGEALNNYVSKPGPIKRLCERCRIIKKNSDWRRRKKTQ